MALGAFIAYILAEGYVVDGAMDQITVKIRKIDGNIAILIVGGY